MIRLLILFLLGSLLAVTADAAPPDGGQGPVMVVSVPGLLRKPAHLFDLRGKTLRFLPQNDGTYRVQTRRTAELAPSPRLLTQSEQTATQWKQALPFSFRFGGKIWTELFVNRNGNLSFGRSENDLTRERNPWASGGMRSIAAVLDERSAAGQEALIAALWAVNDTQDKNGKISIDAQKDRFVVTWEVQRIPWGHAVEGRDLFQARLYPDGVVEIAYPRIARQDGIVGLFPGTDSAGTRLDHGEVKTAASPSSSDVTSVDVFDVGSALKFVFTQNFAIPARLEQGRLAFRIALDDGVVRPQSVVEITDHIRGYAFTDADPRTIGYHLEGKRLAVYVSKTRLVHPADWTWSAAVERTQNGKQATTEIVPAGNPRRARLKKAQGDEQALTKARQQRAGNLFEVFHYSWVTKASRPLLKSIYTRLPAEDDIAVVFTDFRIDDLFAQGPSTGALNLPIQGIGESGAHPRSTRDLGSVRLQVTPATVWIGAPFFSERGPDENGEPYRNFARGVAWLAHEISHRWGPELRFHNPLTGNEEPLTTDSPHWLTDLNAPSMVTMPPLYRSGPTNAFSVMIESKGTEWRTNPDGTFQFRRYPWWTGMGYSALDLYIMGLIPPDQVPDTFLMQDIKPVSPESTPQNGWSAPVTATRVPVRMQDILAVMGPRVPDAAHAQKEFRLGVYLVHEPGRKVDAALLDRANRVSQALADFFRTATGGRMKIVFSSQISRRTANASPPN